MEDDVEAVARRIVEEFRGMCPYASRGSSLAVELDRMWRVVQHWKRRRDSAVAYSRRVKAAAIQYKKAQDFELFEMRYGRGKLGSSSNIS